MLGRILLTGVMAAVTSCGDGIGVKSRCPDDGFVSCSTQYGGYIGCCCTTCETNECNTVCDP